MKSTVQPIILLSIGKGMNRRVKSTPKTALIMTLVSIVLLVSCRSPAQAPSEPQGDFLTVESPTPTPNPTPSNSTKPVLHTPTAIPSLTATAIPPQLVPTPTAQLTGIQLPNHLGTPTTTQTQTPILAPALTPTLTPTLAPAVTPAPTPTLLTTPIEQSTTIGPPSPTPESTSLSIDELIEQTRDEEWKNRWDAVNELGKREDPRGIPALAERALYDDNSHPRWRSLWALAAVESDGSTVKSVLLSGLDESDPIVVRNAAVALSFFGFDEAKPELLNGLSDSDNYLRREAVFSLRELPGPDVVLELLLLLDPANEPADNIRSEAALTVGRIGGAEFAPQLLKVLKTDPVPGVRLRAAISLSRFADAAIVEELIQVLITEESEPVRKLVQDTVDDFKQTE